MSLKVKKKTKNHYEIIQLIGDASSEETYKLSKALEDVRIKGSKNIAVDMLETTFIDSSALGILIFNWKILKEEGGDLCLLSSRGYVREVLSNAKLDTVFRILESEEGL